MEHFDNSFTIIFKDNCVDHKVFLWHKSVIVIDGGGVPIVLSKKNKILFRQIDGGN